jgi:hypothetical protein
MRLFASSRALCPSVLPRPTFPVASYLTTQSSRVFSLLELLRALLYRLLRVDSLAFRQCCTASTRHAEACCLLETFFLETSLDPILSISLALTGVSQLLVVVDK